MKTLTDILLIIGHKNFNDLIMTFISGDEDWIDESIESQQSITVGGNYIEDLCANHGYNTDNFPWDELRAYCNLVSVYLEHNLIIPLP